MVFLLKNEANIIPDKNLDLPISYDGNDINAYKQL